MGLDVVPRIVMEIALEENAQIVKESYIMVIIVKMNAQKIVLIKNVNNQMVIANVMSIIHNKVIVLNVKLILI